MINVIHVVLNHYGDWTELTEKYDVVIDNPYYVPVQSMGINFELFRIHERYGSYVKELINRIRNHGSTIVKVINVIPNREYTDAVMYGDYSKSVKSIFVNNMFIISYSSFKYGLEYYTAILPPIKASVNKTLSELKSQLKEKADVISFKQERAKQLPVKIITELTPMERDVINTAYELGFFNYPRGANLDDVAKELKLSKATVDYHLRNAIRKIISSYLMKKEKLCWEQY
ncbi:helix-turn-helix domain-containing protein [Caldivirga maquilingensis]|uniref:Bacterio-opsin activator HTH domain protein n=1 Tax=Caldivirga maquilingensis (strain ATCC 700844 / DSM 13496 / JCM 10307 / IC-167) TaxID=397948 RepID=A8M9V8_CALMQ|nr:helix-turn-helix domain-containing protein [Caldivirga maquilingensis]ABW02429.1 Bacterio-opsin activator HTH domain protein [Caldivirga maquilingensis IC-167]